MTDYPPTFNYLYVIKMYLLRDLIMDIKEESDKIQRGYHAMIDDIESLIRKEGKTLKQALEVAEDKLEDWEDLTIDQAKLVRSEVRHDLHALGDKLYDAKSSFMHRLEMDKNFIKKSASHKLASIADKTIYELIELKDSLFDQDEELTSHEIIQSEHLDHARWRDDHLFWLAEIAMWRKETRDAEAKILAIHDAVNKHGVSLQDHVKNIRSHDEAEHDHEVKLATLEKALKDDAAESSRDQLAHEIMSKSHKSQALHHQQFKNKHREIVMLVERLYGLTHE